MNSQEVKKIRSAIGLSQAEFARQFSINIHTLRQWERKDSLLDSAVAAYLRCIEANANAVLNLLKVAN